MSHEKNATKLKAIMKKLILTVIKCWISIKDTTDTIVIATDDNKMPRKFRFGIVDGETLPAFTRISIQNNKLI